jgi:hypothetical protein
MINRFMEFEARNVGNVVDLASPPAPSHSRTDRIKAASA